MVVCVCVSAGNGMKFAFACSVRQSRLRPNDPSLFRIDATLGINEGFSFGDYLINFIEINVFENHSVEKNVLKFSFWKIFINAKVRDEFFRQD